MAEKIHVLPPSEIRRVFGDFEYRNTGGGAIDIDAGWVRENIVDCVLKEANGGKDVRTRCHRLAKEPLERAFEAVAARGLSRLITTYDGLWVPRHQLWKDNKPLSRHSWGTAFDLNADRNPYGGGISPENAALNVVFNRCGFAWGGDWSPRERDAMHWELAQLDAGKTTGAREGAHLIIAASHGDDWSYHRMAKARLVDGRFIVDRQELAGIWNRRLSVGESPVRDAIGDLGMTVTQISDKLADADDPRVYVFVK